MSSDKKEAEQAAAGCVQATVPIWLYFLYRILKAIEASDFDWFLFTAYCSLTVIIGLVRVGVGAITGK